MYSPICVHAFMFVITLLAARGVTFNNNALLHDTDEDITPRADVDTLLDRHVSATCMSQLLISYSLILLYLEHQESPKLYIGPMINY